MSFVDDKSQISAEELYGAEFAEWISLTPAERFSESMKLWQFYLQVGGSLDPEPDPQSPFYLSGEWSAPPPDARPGVRFIRRSGV